MILNHIKQKIKETIKILHSFKILNLILSKILFLNLRYSNYFLFKYENIKKTDYNHSFKGDFQEDIWNHELDYFRKNVMKNPICRFCQNPGVQELRCTNNRKYQIKRDIAIQKFFSNAFRTIKTKNRKGIYLLKEFPYKYKNYFEKSQNYQIKKEVTLP